MKSKRYIEFKIETAENMNKNKVVLFSHPVNKELLSKLLYKIQTELKKFKEE
jgi:hypothetical protein